MINNLWKTFQVGGRSILDAGRTFTLFPPSLDVDLSDLHSEPVGKQIENYWNATGKYIQNALNDYDKKNSDQRSGS